MVAPVWNVIYSLGLLMGIGGSVIFSIERGSSAKHNGSENQSFTAAVLGSVLWAGLACGSVTAAGEWAYKTTQKSFRGTTNN